MISLICLIVAMILFLISGFGLATGKVNLVAIGLAFLTGAILTGVGIPR